MVLRYLLDTNTCIAVMRGHPVAVQRMAAVAPGDCAISTVTAYELYTGVEKCPKPAQERSKVELLLTTVWEMPFDADAAREAARLRALLESQGQAIGSYDVLLAGQALARSLALVTANTREFSRVPGLTLENWLI
jgi:tRNA(fMet)-specific endonuclease VapC